MISNKSSKIVLDNNIRDESLNDDKVKRFNVFLECLNSIAADIIAQDSKNQEEQKEKSQKKNLLGSVFVEIPLLIHSIMEFIDENGIVEY